MKSLFLLLIFATTTSYASTYQLQCSGKGYKNKTDSFEVLFDTDKQLLSIDTEAESYPFLSTVPGKSTDLGAIDPKFYPARFTETSGVVEVEVDTYNYFGGLVRFFLGAGLQAMTKDIQYSLGGDNSASYKIAVEYDDGDGFGFHKRNYTCKVRKY